jgi:excisionase family DNA binding protein
MRRRRAVADPPRRLNRTRAPEPASGDVRGHRRDIPRLAVSTGEAARHCLVSADTIANWIADGALPAQRTRGGQYRIWVDDLRSFMAAHGMRTDTLDHDLGLTPTCWEFWASIDQTSPCPTADSACTACPVYRSRADICHEVRPLLPGGTVRAPSCVDCLYFITVRGIERDEP